MSSSMTTVACVSVEAFAAECSAGTDAILLDVRGAPEREIAAIDGSMWIPVGELAARVGELDATRPYVITCHRGPRAERAADILQAAGFGQLRLLDGGIDAWAERVDTTLARYA